MYIYGFYTHAGHSYSVTSQEEAEAHLRNEIEHVRAAADLCRKLPAAQDLHLVLSVGATPTAHAAPVTMDPESKQDSGDTKTTLELHAGNFAILDLQQTSTTLAPLSHIASWIEGEVLSIYPTSVHRVLVENPVVKRVFGGWRSWLRRIVQKRERGIRGILHGCRRSMEF